ncbi:MAG: T9SS type A sorting domain-containing protein [Bacteroidota bacterium]
MRKVLILATLFFAASTIHAQIIRTDGAVLMVSPTATVVTPGGVSIQSSGSVQNAGTVYLGDDWVNNGQGLTGSLNGTVDFNGNQTQFISGSAITDFSFLRVSNPTGIMLSNNVNIEKTLIFNSGKIITGPYEVRMINTPTNPIVGAGLNTYINGNLRVAFDTNTQASYKYEIGSSEYAPLTLTLQQIADPGTMLAYTVAGPSSQENVPTVGASAMDPFARVDRHWVLSQSGMVFAGFDATFDYSNSAYTGTPQDYQIRHKDPISGWQTENTSNNGSVASSVQRDGLFVIGELANTSVFETSASSIQVFPNPATETLQLSGEELLQGETTLSLIDFTGKVVWTDSQILFGSLTIDLRKPQISPGAYVLALHDINRTNHIRFIVR